ncbi:MAG: HAMP domain-containing protein [Candidatus Omnitrophica bacterium]|nr:HAMP domain-containing protein [Candidatus Omnitrophota bacterium]
MRPLNIQFLRDLKITTKFILWFLFISLIPLSLAIYVSYTSARGALKEEVKRSLVAVADNKANRIEAYFQRAKRDASNLSFTPEIIEVTARLADTFKKFGRDSQQYIDIISEYRPMLEYYQRAFDCEEIILVNFDGDVLFSTQVLPVNSLYELALFKKSELTQAFIRSKSSRETETSEFEYLSQEKKAVVFIITPVFRGADSVGFVVFQISNSGLYEFVKDYTGLGQTGETIIVSRSGDEAFFITPVRFDPQATFKRKVLIGSREGADIQNSLKGENGFATLLDYRKEKVFSVYRSLPTFGLGMVVKMDAKEVFSSADELRGSLLKITTLLSVLVIILAVVIAHSVSSPIKDLTQVSKNISQGDLSARVEIDSSDEIGGLARSFNQMTDSLVEANADIERKNNELQEQKRLLEEANKELDSFVYTVSHDLRAPLRGIDGFAKFLVQDYSDKLDEEGKGFLKRIVSGVSRMQQLIDDLLELSRISRIKNPYENTIISELLKSVLSRIEFDITKFNVEMRIAEKMPIVYCDRIKIEEVFLNLINNAIKFSSKNKESNPRVEVGYHDRGDRHEFYVKDNGIGIDKKHQDEVFGIFKRLHRQDEYEGSGAGLSIVKKIIDDHKGSIWIESELGKGAAFYFTIPKKSPQGSDGLVL